MDPEDAHAPRDLTMPAGDILPLIAFAGKLSPEHRAIVDAVRRPAAHGGERRIGLADCFRVLRALAQTAGDETFAMSARPTMKGAAEFVFSSASHSATIGEAMRKIAQAYNLLHGDDYNRVEQRGSSLVYTLADEGFPYTRPRDDYLHFSLECALIFLHSALSELAGKDLSNLVKRVATRRRNASGQARAALGFWDAPVSFGADAYAVVYDAAVAALPLATLSAGMAPDLAVHNRIISLIEARQARDTAQRSIEAAVRTALTDGLHDQDQVAERLGVSVATLRRRLTEAGVTFRDLRHAVLNDRAKAALADQAAVAAVAEVLGFSDMRSFTRAFKSWNGITPSAFRDSHRVNYPPGSA